MRFTIQRRLLTPFAALLTPTLLFAANADAIGTTAHGDERAVGGVHRGFASDPDDTLGRLDVAKVSDKVLDVGRDHYQVSYRISTFAAFATGQLDPSSRNLVIELDRDGQPGSERNVRISSRGGQLVAEVISNATREVIGTAAVSRPNDKTVQISGPRRLLGARAYFWTSNFHRAGSADCDTYPDGSAVVCQDSVPDVGWLRLDRPAWPELTDLAAAVGPTR